MIAWLETLPTFWNGVVIIGGFVISTLVMGYIVATFTSQEVRQAHNDRAGFILAVIGVIYAVLLAFVAIGVWERFQSAQSRTFDEAASLASVYRAAEDFAQGAQIRTTLRAYVTNVITEEWPLMRHGKRSDRAEVLIDRVDHAVQELVPKSTGLQNVQAEMLTAMDAAMMQRQTRLTFDLRGINAVLWVVLICGAYITVAFTYLFGFDRTIMQQLMIGGLSLMIGLVLFLVVALDYPYRGGISVSPEAYRALLQDFNAGL